MFLPSRDLLPETVHVSLHSLHSLHSHDFHYSHGSRQFLLLLLVAWRRRLHSQPQRRLHTHRREYKEEVRDATDSQPAEEACVGRQERSGGLPPCRNCCSKADSSLRLFFSSSSMAHAPFRSWLCCGLLTFFACSASEDEDMRRGRWEGSLMRELFVASWPIHNQHTQSTLCLRLATSILPSITSVSLTACGRVGG